MLSFDELEKMDTIGRNFYETDPPVGPIHNIAEFEPMQAGKPYCRIFPGNYCAYLGL
jgi:hypothetical protein